MFSYFEFLLEQFNEDDQVESSREMLVELMSPNVAKTNITRPFLFVSNESVYKLARIGAWFAQRENDSELYDESGAHVDIHEKLRFGKMRFEFVKKALVMHAKLTSLGFKRDLSDTFKNNFNRLLNAFSTSKSLIAHLGK